MSEELLGYLLLAAIMAFAVAVVWLVGKQRK
jgi:hypothetical protein